MTVFTHAGIFLCNTMYRVRQ